MSTREFLRQRGIEPRKSLGQNFLTDPGAARRIVDAARIEPGDLVFEIGPGAGALTQFLVRCASRVIAVEADASLIPVLQQELDSPANLTVIHGDALEVDFLQLAASGSPAAPVRFVGNLPYYITSAIVRRILECDLDTRIIVVTVQREVAERMIAEPGDMSLLSVGVQFYGQARIALRLPPGAFYPQPGVDSAVVCITPHHRYAAADRHAVFRLARAGFSQPRKQLRNTLAAGLAPDVDKAWVDRLLMGCHIDPSRRAETLTLDEWVALAGRYVVMLEKRD